MIDDSLVKRNSAILESIALGNTTAESNAGELVELLNETDSNYIKLIEDNAQLHKDNATLRNRLKVLESS